jgi:hypothetical protein
MLTDLLLLGLTAIWVCVFAVGFTLAALHVFN